MATGTEATMVRVQMWVVEGLSPLDRSRRLPPKCWHEKAKPSHKTQAARPKLRTLSKQHK
eukprot:scaffold14723_cov89-Skeletonema_marinoi.AAC.2